MNSLLDINQFSNDHLTSEPLKSADIQSTEPDWSIQDSSKLYGIDRWGKDYFSINEIGNVEVQPKGDATRKLDLKLLVKDLESRNLKLPLLIRFDDILEDRLVRIHNAFEKAITRYNYTGIYQGVFPIKCNQHRHVVEEIISCGKPWDYGLEAGSKAELLIALAVMENSKGLLICNGYKDARYIETAILARQLERQPIVVIEQSNETERIISASKTIGAAPLIGIRAKLSSRSSGRWSESIGERAKFGLSIPEILSTAEKLKREGLLQEVRLLHFHVGSQINDIALLKDALQEASQIYVELSRLGAPMGYLDVGGGLGIDYDGSQTATEASTNYSLQNYANDVVATVKESCEANNIAMPTLISESGRAIASHFSILLFNILGTSGVSTITPPKRTNESLIIRNLRETLKSIEMFDNDQIISSSKLQEAWNDALKFKEDALNAFRLGYIGLRERSTAEQLTWVCARALVDYIPQCDPITEELIHLREVLAKTYYANISIFRSAPDTWAIKQLFPIMPIHRLTERPSQLGDLADLTCDSDGKLSRFIDNGKAKPLLELHEINSTDDYIIGMFLGGAYQEVMGNLHNLFGSTNSIHIRTTDNNGYKLDHVIRGNTKADVLQTMEHDPNEVIEKLRLASEQAIQKGNLKISDAQKLMDHLEDSLRQSTYLHK